MSDEKAAASGLAKAVDEIAAPFYRDEPDTEELGRAVARILRTVNLGLYDVETIGAFFRDRLEPRLSQIPPDHRNNAPKLNVVGPAVESVRFTSEDDELQNLFANLIARAMDKRVAARAHPAFVRIINELTSDEAKILRAIGPGRPVPMVNIDRAFLNARGERISGDTPHESLSRFGHDAGCELPMMFPTFISNLVRLRLVESLAPGTQFSYPGAEAAYQRIETDPEVFVLAKSYDLPPKQRHEFVRWGVKQTPLGHDFWDVCVRPYEDRAV
jgi:hypothetical protein